jgi:phosphoglucosamine mutase
MLANKQLKKKTLVTTVMSNLGLERAMREAGGKLIRTPVGDRYVVERMRKGGYCFGGEQSGHLIFLDHATTGDGIVAALQLLAICVEEERPLSELARQVMHRVPQVLVSEKFTARKRLEAMATTKKAIAAVEKKLGDKGRVVTRWSGTEPKLRVMVEGENERACRKHADRIISAAARDLAS